MSDTIEQKAKEIVGKFIQYTRVLDDKQHYADDMRSARACALIDVQNTIDGIKEIIGSEKHMWTSHEADVISKYEQVKEKIQSL